jgi:hypothetical protein
MVELLVGFRTEVAEPRARSTPVVQCLNVVEEVSSLLHRGARRPMMYSLSLKRAGEAFIGTLSYQLLTSFMLT